MIYCIQNIQLNNVFSNLKMKMMIPTYVLELPTKVVSSNYDHSFEFLSLSENCCLRTLLIILFVAVLGRDGRGTISETWKCYPFVRKKIDKLIELQCVYTLNRGFNFFWRAELKDAATLLKSNNGLSRSFNTTATTNRSGPPPGGGTATAAVSKMSSLTELQMRSISTELTWMKKQKLTFIIEYI